MIKISEIKKHPGKCPETEKASPCNNTKYVNDKSPVSYGALIPNYLRIKYLQ